MYANAILTSRLGIFRPISGGSMNPVRTIAPAIASDHYKGIWVYIVGDSNLAGAWSYNLIRLSNKPVHPISPRSFSFKVCHLRRQDGDFPNKEHVNDLRV